MNMEAKAKPERVDVGQRWKWTPGVGEEGNPSPFKIARLLPGNRAMCFYEEDEDAPEMPCPVELILAEAIYLSSPPVAGVAMEADVVGNPVMCLKCGANKPTNGRKYVCHVCFATIGELYDREDEWEPLRDAWLAGARDFPRPALTPAPTAAPAPVAATGPRPTLCKHGEFLGCKKGSCAVEARFITTPGRQSESELISDVCDAIENAGFVRRAHLTSRASMVPDPVEAVLAVKCTSCRAPVGTVCALGRFGDEDPAFCAARIRAASRATSTRGAW